MFDWAFLMGFVLLLFFVCLVVVVGFGLGFLVGFFVRWEWVCLLVPIFEIEINSQDVN